MAYFKSIPNLSGSFGEAGWIPSITEMNIRGIEWSKLIQKPGQFVYVPFKSIHWVLAPVSLGKFHFI